VTKSSGRVGAADGLVGRRRGRCRRPGGQGTDREKGTGEEEGDDGHGRQRADVFLLGGEPVGEHLGRAVHGDGEGEGGGAELHHSGRFQLELGAADGGGTEEHGHLEAGEGHGHDELHMALNTVKKHATHIFDKLGATNRTEATVRAREFGLLSQRSDARCQHPGSGAAGTIPPLDPDP
jgi:hypothetical protein